MKLGHIAIWTMDLEHSRSFYELYFGGRHSEKYVNDKKGFSSYFVIFDDGVSLEIMKRDDIIGGETGDSEKVGLAHFAFHVGSKDMVNDMIERFRSDGHEILGEPRLTGDGFYEGVVADPDGNRVEIVC